MIKNIFLTYANNSLRDDPTNLHTVFEAIQSSLDINLEDIPEVINTICGLSKIVDPRLLLEFTKKNADARPMFGRGTTTSLAFEAVAGNRDMYYYDADRFKDHPDMTELLEYSARTAFSCQLRMISKAMLGDDLCTQSFVLKCYECHQLAFVNSLNEIVAGKEYSEIEEIDCILWGSSIISMKVTDLFVEKSDKGAPFKEALIGHNRLVMSLGEYIDTEHGNSDHTFNEYLSRIAYYSLTEFLLRNDRRKLKKCPYCEKFFVAKNISRQRCYSDDCHKAHERLRKRKYREADLVKYY